MSKKEKEDKVIATKVATLQQDIKHLADRISEQDALASFDLVYFLLVPVALFVMDYLYCCITRPPGPIWATAIAAFFPAALVSLPFGVHGTLSGSVGGRIRAWAIFTLVSSLGFGNALVLYSCALVVPSFFPLRIDRWLTWWFSLAGFSFVGIGVAAIWMGWVFRTFERRVPSRVAQMESALDVPVLRGIVKPYVRARWHVAVSVFVIGLVFYFVFFVLYWLESLGWNIP
jgi:hypothetical protein